MRTVHQMREERHQAFGVPLVRAAAPLATTDAKARALMEIAAPALMGGIWALPDYSTHNMATIQGSAGILRVQRATGRIVSYDPDGFVSVGDDDYSHIERFDPATLTGCNLDILECGFWYSGGQYEPPEPDFMAHLSTL